MNLKKYYQQQQKYSRDKKLFKELGGQITSEYPILGEHEKPAGSFGGHYFHQDLLVASMVFSANPLRHVDVGSSIEGFVSHVASFRSIEVFDIRPLSVQGHAQISFIQGDLMNLAPALTEYCDSISCLHALEHFGLGRYGDPIDPDGHLKGFSNLTKMLVPGGVLYVSVPIGERAVYFNAHRVFASVDPLEWAKDALALMRFDFVDDSGNLHTQRAPSSVPSLNYGCGIYTFLKKKRSS